MVRWALLGSYVIFNLVLIALLWGDTWLPRAYGVATLSLILFFWLVAASFLFRHMHLTPREKVAGWLFVGALVGYTVLRRFSRYYSIHGPVSTWLVWTAAGLLVILTTFGLAAIILGKRTSASASNFTVESVAPDHVIHLASTPNYSLKRTAANRHGVD